MSRTKIVPSSADELINLVQNNLAGNFKNRREGLLQLPSLRNRALGVVNEDQVYQVDDEDVNNVD